MTPPWQSRDSAPYIIAEIGVNHDGSVRRAIELVDCAAGAGADAVKLQLFQTDLLMSKAAVLATYQRTNGQRDPFAMLRRLELSIDELTPIVRRAAAHALDAIVTVFSVELVAAAERLEWNAYKTASPDIIHKPLLEALGRTGKPIIISTGASTMAEVTRAAGWLAAARDRIAFLQCVSSYPTPMEQAALGGIAALRNRLGGTVGYSDHTSGVMTGAMAVEAGADILEKHLTYDRAALGPDHAASLDPGQFECYVAKARTAALATAGQMNEARNTSFGMAQSSLRTACRTAAPPQEATPTAVEKKALDIEQDVRHASRQSVTARRDLRAGDRLDRSDVAFKRPGVGIEPWRVDDIVGRTLARPVAADTPIVEDDLA